MLQNIVKNIEIYDKHNDICKTIMFGRWASKTWGPVRQRKTRKLLIFCKCLLYVSRPRFILRFCLCDVSINERKRAQ